MYKPIKIADFAGAIQREVAQALKASASSDMPMQAVLFLGQSGVGKTSLSHFYADLLDAEIEHINCIDKASVDYVRDLIERLRVPSLFHRHRVYLLDEIHGWSGKAQEGILVPLESLPKHVIFLATSTEPQKIKDTVKSRFTTYNLPVPNATEIKQLMMRVFDVNCIVVDKNIERWAAFDGGIKISPDYAREVLIAANGNLRTLVKLIEEQVVSNTFAGGGAVIGTDDIVATIYRDIADNHLRYDYDVVDYPGTLVALAYYALGVLKRTPGNDVAMRVLGQVGIGLNPTLPPDLAFYALLSS